VTGRAPRALLVAVALIAAALVVGVVALAADDAPEREDRTETTMPRADRPDGAGEETTMSSTRGRRTYPWHTDIVATTFWVGELFDGALEDGSQVCSTYDSKWAYHWSGIDQGRVPDDAPGCPGAILGGCDGVWIDGRCETEPRTAHNDWFPTQVRPLENPFDDLHDPIGFARRCEVIPWANDPGYAGRCHDRSFSYMKNRWVRLVGPNGRVGYGQIQDAGPSHDDLYHDVDYVFGSDDARPMQQQFNNAGIDVSPALNGYLGFAELNGSNDRVDWQFVEREDVPDGPWTIVETTSGVS
jgi:hypothetical protein